MVMLLLRVARRPVAPITALYRPTRCALFQSFSAFSTGPTQADDTADAKRTLTSAERLALLPPTLTAFHARHGHFIMYSGFKIPTEDDEDVYLDLPPYPEAARGLRMGSTLHNVLVNSKTRSKHTRTLQALEAIGFPVDVDWQQYVWERQRLPALRVYRELYGNLLVPPLYIVPTGDTRWPIETWGFKLGKYTHNVKYRDHRGFQRQQLEDLDLVNGSWKFKALTPTERLALLAPTLQVFHMKYGHFTMPFSFVVPKDDDVDGVKDCREEDASDEAWPPRARGEMLGNTLYAFMTSELQQRENPHVVQALADIGFPVDVDWKHYFFERQPLAAFRVYRELYGDGLVPKSFDVPIGDSKWPKETWGFKLGSYANSFRHSGHRFLTREQLSALAELGLSWALNGLPLAKRLPLVAPTLRAFYARHGHFIMHANFIIPIEDDSATYPHLPPYPDVVRGLKFGTTLHHLLVRDQSRQKYSHVLQELKEIGFPVDVDWKQYEWDHQRLPAFRVYVELHGDCHVPQSFVVPAGDSNWPIETWGFRLGSYASRIRQKDYRILTQAQLDQLDELNFYTGRHDKRRSTEKLTLEEQM